MRKRSALGALALSAAAYPFWEARRPRLRRYQLLKAPGTSGLKPEEASYIDGNLPDLRGGCCQAQRRCTGKESAATIANRQLNPTWQIRILHLSDLHLWSKSEWLTKYVASLAEFTEIDFVALTGDNFCDASGLEMLRRALTPLTVSYTHLTLPTKRIV